MTGFTRKNGHHLAPAGLLLCAMTGRRGRTRTAVPRVIARALLQDTIGARTDRVQRLLKYSRTKSAGFLAGRSMFLLLRCRSRRPRLALRP